MADLGEKLLIDLFSKTHFFHLGVMDTTPERPSKRRANFPTPTFESTTIHDNDKEEALNSDNK